MSFALRPPVTDAPASGGTSAGGVLLLDVLLVCMAAIWGANVSVVKYGTEVISPLAYNGVRVLMAAACLIPIGFLGASRKPSRRDVIGLLWLGVLGHGVYQLLFIEGVARTRAGDAALLLAGTPALIAVLSWRRGFDRMTRRSILGVALSTIGIILVVLGTDGRGLDRRALMGDLLIVGSGATWAAFTILLKPYADRVDPVQVAALTMTGGVGPLLLVCAPAVYATAWAAVPGLLWLALLFSSVFALVIAYLLWYRGVRVLGPTRTSMYGNLQPIFGLMFAWIMLGELPTPLQGLGAGSILGGLLLTRS